MSTERTPRIAAVLTLDELRAEVESGGIDTVVVAFTDMQGRLLGKRLHGEFFCDEMTAEHEVEGCNYLLALDMEMDPIPGYEIASWERGYGDFAMKPDLATLRRIPGSRRRHSSSRTSSGTTDRRSRPRRGRCCERRWSGRPRSGSPR